MPRSVFEYWGFNSVKGTQEMGLSFVGKIDK